ncbi:MAG: rRNA pseudouridine synthase [Candidatus Pacebacteria bacterium]|nr:rRNA pseudouridine synthase [Candidatus Paceibacterota bacterium]
MNNQNSKQNNQGKSNNHKQTGTPDRSQYPKIQAYIAKLGIMSRRNVEDLIREKKVQVNGTVAKIGQRIKAGQDVIVLDGKKITTSKPPQPIYILLNKPKGYVSTVKDEANRKTVLELVPEEKERLYPVGRLDIDSEGLMILTNDGDFTYKMTHPSNEIKKTYHVLIGGSPSNLALNHLQRGVKLKEGYVQPDEVNILRHETGNTWLEIILHEGKNRIIRRMMRRIGYNVIRLVRVKMGPFDVKMLGSKRSIKLTKDQVEELFTDR